MDSIKICNFLVQEKIKIPNLFFSLDPFIYFLLDQKYETKIQILNHVRVPLFRSSPSPLE